MSDLFVLQNALAHAINTDSVLCLVHAAAWLDPLRSDPDDGDTPESQDDTVFVALHILRRAFPEIYFDALQASRQGASYTDLDRLICTAITAHGIPLDDLEWIASGIPLPAYGAALDDPDFYTAHPAVIPVLECFGVSPEPNPYPIDVPDCVYTAGHFIAADLQRHDDEHFRQIGWLLHWLFSSSGNSSVDYDYETMCEFQPLSWEADDLAFAIEIIQEADGIMADALAGLAFLTSQPELMQTLQDNAQRIYKAIERQKERQGDLKVHLSWTRLLV